MKHPHSNVVQPARLLMSLGAALLCFVVSSGALPAQQRKMGLKPGNWQKRHCPPGWLLYHSKHYQIQSQVGLEKAKRLAAHMEGMNRIYRKLFPPGKGSTKRFAVKLLKDRQTFLAYGQVPQAAAYYSKTDRELVLYDTGKWSDRPEAAITGDKEPRTMEEEFERLRKRGAMDILGVAAHEGWHQYFHWYVTSWIELPSWINEGMGDYFYTVHPAQVGRKVQGLLGSINATRFPTILDAVVHNKHVPIKKLIRYLQSDYYANAGLCYAEGWSLCYFLLHSKNKAYNKIVPKFIKRFKDRGNWKKNTDLVFKRIDLDKLEADWKAWILKLKPDAKNGRDKLLQDLLRRLRARKKAKKRAKPDPTAPKGSERHDVSR